MELTAQTQEFIGIVAACMGVATISILLGMFFSEIFGWISGWWNNIWRLW